MFPLKISFGNCGLIAIFAEFRWWSLEGSSTEFLQLLPWKNPLSIPQYTLWQSMLYNVTDWWFGTWFFHSVGNVIIPTVTHSIIFQRATNQCYFLSPPKVPNRNDHEPWDFWLSLGNLRPFGLPGGQEFSKFRRGHPEAELMGWFIRGWLSQSWRCCYGDMVMKGEIVDFFMGKSTRTPNQKNGGKDTMGLP